MSSQICSQANGSTISIAILIFEAHEVIQFVFINLNCFLSISYTY